VLQTILAAASSHLVFTDLGLNPNVFSIPLFGTTFALKWYSLAYIAGLAIGWWYLLKLIAQPGAPMAKRHADDLFVYAALGVILGGRIGYVLFYQPMMLLNPISVLKLWDGGMSFHGGVIGTSLGLIWMAHRHKLDWLRIHDYVACCAPIGLFLGRCANFVNGELWGKPTDVPWAVVFPHTVAFGPEPARHPSQLYEAGLEGLLLFALLAFLFWRTRARWKPGLLVGVFLLGYGLARFFVEFFREPDRQFEGTFLATTIHMGQLLTLPMIAGGIYLIVTAHKRSARAAPVRGSESVA